MAPVIGERVAASGAAVGDVYEREGWGTQAAGEVKVKCDRVWRQNGGLEINWC